MLRKIFYNKKGQGTTEYILLVILLALGLIAAIAVFRNKLGKKFQDAGKEISETNRDSN